MGQSLCSLSPSLPAPLAPLAPITLPGPLAPLATSLLLLFKLSGSFCFFASSFSSYYSSSLGFPAPRAPPADYSSFPPAPLAPSSGSTGSPLFLLLQALPSGSFLWLQNSHLSPLLLLLQIPWLLPKALFCSSSSPHRLPCLLLSNLTGSFCSSRSHGSYLRLFFAPPPPPTGSPASSSLTSLAPSVPPTPSASSSDFFCSLRLLWLLLQILLLPKALLAPPSPLDPLAHT